MQKIIKKLKNYGLALAIGLSVIVPVVAVATPAFADTAASKSAACAGITAAGGTCSGSGSGTSLSKVVRFVINLLSIIAGIAAVIMIIVGGLKYITSSGDPANINSAKNTLLYAIIGLVIVAMAQIIVKFVLKKAS